MKEPWHGCFCIFLVVLKSSSGEKGDITMCAISWVDFIANTLKQSHRLKQSMGNIFVLLFFSTSNIRLANKFQPRVHCMGFFCC